MDHIVGGKFKLGKKIGSGSFGELFLGQLAALLQYCYCIFLLAFGMGSKMLTSPLFLLAAVNVQTGEEVAVKLVLGSVLLCPKSFG